MYTQRDRYNSSTQAPRNTWHREQRAWTCRNEWLAICGIASREQGRAARNTWQHICWLLTELLNASLFGSIALALQTIIILTQRFQATGTDTFACGIVIVEGSYFIDEGITFENSMP